VRRVLVTLTLGCSLTLTPAMTGNGAAADTVAPARWVHAVCAGGTAWLKALDQSVHNIPPKIAGPDPAASKRALVDFLKTAARSTDRFRKRLLRTGTPNVSHGEDLADALTQALGDARRAFKVARAAVAKLATTDAGALQAGVDAARAALNDELSKVSLALARLVDGTAKKLGRAVNDDPACHALPPLT
jgi:hypothetical protein